MDNLLKGLVNKKHLYLLQKKKFIEKRVIGIYVNDIHYNSKGQRSTIWYGNGTKTSYTYDTDTFRLRRLLTVNLHYNDILQDLHYWYDPVGNITEIQDDAQQTLFYDNSVVAPTQKFIYDALYRLIEASGRELIGTASFGAEDNYNDAAWQTTHKGDGNAVQNYTQHYTYDEAGNILELKHIAATGSYTRTYDIDTDSNRLLSTQVGMTPAYEYDYDTRGNMTEMPHLSNMVWNMDNELSSTVKGGNPTHYQYSGGQRVRKYTDKGSLAEERIYLGNFELYRKYDNSGDIDVERSTVHISDDTGRIAMLEERTVGTDSSPAELTRYIYSNHLQSASLELNEDAEIISYEEYHPYGTTSYQAMNATINAVAKRYRYTGKERDEESGLYYHGARYYIPWLCRWSAVDSSENKNTPKSSYCYCSNNPVSKFDPDGKDEIYFNYLYVRKSLIDTGNFNQYGVDSFHPQNFGVQTSEYQVYQWMSVVKNDKPNTYHINKFNFDFSTDGSTNGPQKDFSKSWSISDERAQRVHPNSNSVPKDIKDLYQSFSDFSRPLTENYGSTQITSAYGAKSQSARNFNSVHNLLNNSKKYEENVRDKELEKEMFLFAIGLVVTELLVLKLARGGSWIGRLGDEGITSERLVRVIPEQFAGSPTLGAPGSLDVFVTTASELKGLKTSKEIAEKLTLLNSEGKLIQGPFRVIEFDVPATGLAQPIRRTNSGFIHGGKTAGGATEYVIPNYNISDLKNVIQTTVK